MRYVIASGFLGRLCWSGYIDKLSGWQLDMLKSAESFYEKVCDIIKDGRSYVYRTDFINNRKPQGTQAVVRYGNDKKYALVVCHFFDNSKEMTVELEGEYEIESSLYKHNISLDGRNIKLCGGNIDADVLLLKRIRKV